MQPSAPHPHRLTRAFPLLIALVAWGCQDSPTSLAPEKTDPPKPSGETGLDGPTERFIVTLRDGPQTSSVTAKHRLRADRQFGNVVNGFATTMTAASRDRLLRDPSVLSVEEDLEVTTTGEPQWDAPWNLDRVDQRPVELDGAYTYNHTGAGVTAYVVDSGIRYSHGDFDGRAFFGFDAYGEDGNDCNGHGTHVAGTIGGQTYGVAKGVDIVSVRVLGCEARGLTSDLVAGLDWVASHAAGPAVVNLSLKAGYSSQVDDAVARLTAMGVNVVAAAGNDDTDACFTSPARAPSALTVGAADMGDYRAYFSNWGDCVDLFAPGVSVRSASHEDDVGSVSMFGTSMATPHVTGAVALYLSSYRSATTAEVTSAVLGGATQGVVMNSESSNNHLLYTLDLAAGDSPPPPNAPPVADFEPSCQESDCAFDDASSDPDGHVARWHWNFGDGSEATTWSPGRPEHSYAEGGTFTVTLTVTDDRGDTDSDSRSVTVAAPPAPPEAIALEAAATKWKGKHVMDLFWAGAAGSSVEILVDGSIIAAAENAGVYTLETSNKGKGSYTLQVCEVGGAACSGEVVVSY
jgi:subtilisin family serine protease